jgi:hypothetical protein
MRVAFIAPAEITPLICGTTDYQLCLPRPLDEHFKYFTFYASSKAFKILDNGAAEGELSTVEDLFTCAEVIKADEVVIPDVIGDGLATSMMARRFKERYGEQEVSWNYMGVVQGNNYFEFMQCADTLANLGLVKTLAIPKHACQTIGRMRARVSLANSIRAEFPDFDIHCLGSDPRYITEVAELAEQGIVRGMDTSMPIFAGLWGFAIRRDNIGLAHRPDDYFGYEATYEEIEVVENNVKTFLEWAKYRKCN